MKSLGHTVYLYASEDNEAPVDELITCITKEQQQEALAGKHFTEAEFNNALPHWQIFNGKAIEELGKRLEQKDFICLIGIQSIHSCLKGCKDSVILIPDRLVLMLAIR